MKNIKIFALYSRFAVKAIAQMPTGVFFFTLGKLIRFLLFFLFVYFLVSKTSTLKGYSADQAIIFYLTFNIVDTTAQLLFREVYRFRELVVSGDLDGILVKPYHPFLRVLLGGVDPMDALMLPLYIILTVIFIFKVPHLISMSSVILYILLIANSLLIATAFHIMILAFGIITSNIDHGVMIYRDVTSLGRFPVEIYREPVRWLFTFVIPVGIMMSFPTQVLFNVLSGPRLVASLLLGPVFFIVALQLWSTALKKYQSWGG